MRFVARKRVGAGSFEGVCNVRCMILLVDIQTFKHFYFVYHVFRGTTR